MVETDPVRIVVEIISNVEDDIEKIRQHLRSLQGRIEADFDIDDDGDIESIRAQLRALQRRLEADFNIDVDEKDVAKVESIRQALGRDINVGSAAEADFLGNIADMNRRTDSFLRRPMFGDRDAAINFDPGFLRSTIAPQTGDFSSLARRGGISPDMQNTLNSARRLRNRFRGLGRTLVRYRPSIMDWWNVLALLIPIMITLAAAAIGAAAALAGVATAGAAIVGIGLLGWGDSASESLQNLQQIARDLGSTLFDVLQPAAQAFQPIQMDAIRALPNMVGRLVDELTALRTFADDLGRMGRGFFQWVEQVLQVINRMEGMITQVAARVGHAFGQFIIDLLSFGLEELHQNQEAYAKLTNLFIDIIGIIFDLAKVVTFVVVAFKPLFDVLRSITSFLSNKWMVALLTFISVMFVGSFVVAELATGFLALRAAMQAAATSGFLSFIGTAIGAIQTAVASTWAWVTAASTLYGVLARIAALTGVGILALVASEAAVRSMSGPAPGARGTSGATVNNINIEGDVGRREMDRIMDRFPSSSSREASIRNTRTP